VGVIVTDDLYSYNFGVQCDGALHNNTPWVKLPPPQIDTPLMIATLPPSTRAALSWAWT